MAQKREFPFFSLIVPDSHCALNKVDAWKIDKVVTQEAKLHYICFYIVWLSFISRKYYVIFI